MSASDLKIEGFRELERELLSIANGEKADAIQRRALRAVTKVIEPALLAATPVSKGKVGSTSLKPLALKQAIQSRVSVPKDGSPPSATTDFGKLSYVANFVDGGHVNPTAVRGLKHTPGTGFIRRTEDETRAEAIEKYIDVIQAGVDEALEEK